MNRCLGHFVGQRNILIAHSFTAAQRGPFEFFFILFNMADKIETAIFS